MAHKRVYKRVPFSEALSRPQCYLMGKIIYYDKMTFIRPGLERRIVKTRDFVHVIELLRPVLLRAILCHISYSTMIVSSYSDNSRPPRQ